MEQLQCPRDVQVGQADPSGDTRSDEGREGRREGSRGCEGLHQGLRDPCVCVDCCVLSGAGSDPGSALRLKDA